MDRQRRATDPLQELLENPCDYVGNAQPKIESDRVASTAVSLSLQAGNAFDKTHSYIQLFTRLHSYNNSEKLLVDWQTDVWLRKTKYASALPEDKVLNQTMNEEHYEQLLSKMDEMLPTMYMGLKMIVAGLYTYANDELVKNDMYNNLPDLRQNINQTMSDARAILCYFNEIMYARNLQSEIKPITNDEIPGFANDWGLLLYRDTLNYLEYLQQVFHRLGNKEA